MKYFFLTLTFILSLNLFAQVEDQRCTFGITFEISNNPSWGFGEPVVTNVEPNSPAKAAGIKPGDIIMEINGAATYLRSFKNINSWLLNDQLETVSLTVRNLDTYFKDYELPRKCRSAKSIDEEELAKSFAFYSLENTQSRKFTLPLRVKTNKDVDYSDYHTFDFIETPDAPNVDSYINTVLEKNLKGIGLTRDTENPDILIQTYYTYQNNPSFKSKNEEKNGYSWRYDTDNQKMELLPILSKAAGKDFGEYILDFGIRFYDQKYIDKKIPTQIWEAAITDYLAEQITLENYVEKHIPLIMMQYPYKTDRVSATYEVDFSKYNYTGMCFNMDDMVTISDVDRNSPAYNSGLRPGMVVSKINNNSFDNTKDEIMNGYKRFIIETMPLRAPSTRFTDAKGFPDCMYWSQYKFNDVAKAFKNKSLYIPSFSYLYGFEPYVNGNSKNEVKVQTKDKTYNIFPEVKSSVTIRAL